MFLSSTKKILISIIIVSFLAWPFTQVEAFIFHDPVHTTVTSLFSGLSTASQAITNFSVGLPGTGSAASGSFLAGKTSCNMIKRTMALADMADISNITTAVEGEGYDKVARLTVKYNALKAVSTCLSMFMEMVATGDPLTAGAGQQAIQAMGFNKVVTAQDLSDINKKMDAVKEQLNGSWTSVWKAISIRLLMQAQQKLTTSLVNNLISKYKINNYTQYANSVAGLVYRPQYISKYVKNGTDQMIVKNILQGGTAANSVAPMLNSRANQAYGVKADNISLSDPNFFQKMASKGTVYTNPSFQTYLAQSNASQVEAMAQTKASEEISANNGFKSSWDCNQPRDSEIYAELDKYVKDVEVKTIALQDLEAQYEVDQEMVDPAEIERAQVEVDAAQTLMNQYAETKKDEPSLCDIINPGSVISSSANNYLSSHLNATANMKDANLPFFARFIESTASNFISNIIGKSGTRSMGSRGIAEVGVSRVQLTPAQVIPVNASLNTLKENLQDSQMQNIVFEGVKTGSDANEYELQWDAENYVGGDNLDETYVIVTGPLGLNKQFNDLKGSMVVGNPIGGTYNLDVYTRGQKVSAKTWVMPAGGTPSYTPSTASSSIESALDLAGSNKDRLAVPVPPDSTPGTGGGIDISIYRQACVNDNNALGQVQACMIAVEQCYSQYPNNQTMMESCITSRGIVLGASIVNNFILRDPSGSAIRIFFSK